MPAHSSRPGLTKIAISICTPRGSALGLPTGPVDGCGRPRCPAAALRLPAMGLIGLPLVAMDREGLERSQVAEHLRPSRRLSLVQAGLSGRKALCLQGLCAVEGRCVSAFDTDTRVQHGPDAALARTAGVMEGRGWCHWVRLCGRQESSECGSDSGAGCRGRRVQLGNQPPPPLSYTRQESRPDVGLV